MNRVSQWRKPQRLHRLILKRHWEGPHPSRLLSLPPPTSMQPQPPSTVLSSQFYEVFITMTSEASRKQQQSPLRSRACTETMHHTWWPQQHAKQDRRWPEIQMTRVWVVFSLILVGWIWASHLTSLFCNFLISGGYFPPSWSNQSILKEINPDYSLEGLMLMLKLQ